MEFTLSPELEAFRQEIRGWIKEHQIEQLKGLDEASHYMGRAECDEELFAQWVDDLMQAHLMCPQWPESVGGRGFSGIQMSIFNQELDRADMPRVTRGIGETLVGPSIIAHGTDEQRAHFLPRIISGHDRYCQGFSEPDAGSDLASLTTRAEVVGDELIITGQKVWTSGALLANMIFILCRTNPDVPKHRGISYVLVPFGEDNNIAKSPIRQMSGSAEFYQEFFDGTRAPLLNVIGGLNNGWHVAMTTLGNERGDTMPMQFARFEREFWDLVDIARKSNRDKDPLIRQELTWAYTHIQILRYSGLRRLVAMALNTAQGPETSIAKLFASEYHRRFGELVMGIEGATGLVRPEGGDYPLDDWQKIFIRSRAETIYSGSNEIQRNIISERALGIPREPRSV